MQTADPQGLADYRRELLETDLPPNLVDQIVLSAADAAHRETVVIPTPIGIDDEWTPGEAKAAIAARRERRAQELAS